jgi:hypothetical protein
MKAQRTGRRTLMQLVEQHVIDRKDPRFAVIDKAAFASKNLYNAALYENGTIPRLWSLMASRCRLSKS